MSLSRRQFLHRSVALLAGGVILYGPLSSLTRRLGPQRTLQELDPQEVEGDKYSYIFVVDATRCIGCGKCVVACKLENHVPMGSEYNRTWVERYVFTEDGEMFVDSPDAGMRGFQGLPENVKYQGLNIAESFFVPKLCNQCENPPCVQVCPVSATYKTKDGVILVDAKRCIGCRYCIQACPYGARYLVPEGGATPQGYSRVADKCTWCYHRITQGLPPACVEVCPVNARMLGDMRDHDSLPRRLLRTSRVYTLKPSLGTEPKVYYVGLRIGVR